MRPAPFKQETDAGCRRRHVLQFLKLEPFYHFDYACADVCFIALLESDVDY